MCRSYTGGDSDRLDGVTLTAIDSGGFSIGCWVYTVSSNSWCGIVETNTGVNTVQMLGQRGGADGIVFGQMYSSGGIRGALSNASVLTHNTWLCVIGVGDGGTGTNYKIWLGSPSAVMADITASNVGTGGGSRLTSGTNLCIGNHGGKDSGAFVDWTANTGSFGGRTFAPFIVPWQMTQAEMDDYRLGDWSVLYAHGQPRGFAPLTGSSLFVLSGQATNLTSTGSSVADDPNVVAGWVNDPVSVMVGAAAAGYGGPYVGRIAHPRPLRTVGHPMYPKR